MAECFVLPLMQVYHSVIFNNSAQGCMIMCETAGSFANCLCTYKAGLIETCTHSYSVVR